MSVKLLISSHGKISYFYMCSDTTFLGGFRSGSACYVLNKDLFS